MWISWRRPALVGRGGPWLLCRGIDPHQVGGGQRSAVGAAASRQVIQAEDASLKPYDEHLGLRVKHCRRDLGVVLVKVEARGQLPPEAEVVLAATGAALRHRLRALGVRLSGLGVRSGLELPDRECSVLRCVRKQREAIGTSSERWTCEPRGKRKQREGRLGNTAAPGAARWRAPFPSDRGESVRTLVMA